MKTNKVILKESDLKTIIIESVRRVFNEGVEDDIYCEKELKKKSKFLKGVNFKRFRPIFPRYDLSFIEHLYIVDECIGWLPANEKELYESYVDYVNDMHNYDDLVTSGKIDPEEEDIWDWIENNM